MLGPSLGVLLTLATTGLLAYAGLLVLRRPVHGEARLALRMFATWWLSAGLVLLLAGSHTMLGLLGLLDVRVHLAITYLTAVPLAVALWALLYYLIYIYTGRRAAIWPLTAAYALFLAFEIYYFSSLGPRTIETTAWSVRLARGRDPPAGLGAVFGLLVAAPTLFIVVAYGRLAARAKEPAQRYRVRLTSTALLVWFAPVLAAFLAGWDKAAWFPLVYQAPGVLAAAMIVAAHRPPGFLKRRWEARGAAGGNA